MLSLSKKIQLLNVFQKEKNLLLAQMEETGIETEIIVTNDDRNISTGNHCF
jgi:hypothetical protein